MKDDVSNLTQLGSKATEYKTSGPSYEMLETFPNRFPLRDYKVTLPFSEFTSLCPRTGQPDFATVTIEYIPDQKIVETKSLKLYFFAWRNEGSFMETITNRILEDVVKACDPRWIKVTGAFNARGGIALKTEAVYEKSE